MQAYQIGQPWPSFFSPGYELCRAVFTPLFFDLVYWLPSYEAENIHLWQQAQVEYGIFISDNIPFFILHFPAKDWHTDVSLNMYAMQTELIAQWLGRHDTSINLLLCDCYSNLLLDIRKIHIAAAHAKQIREVLAMQKQEYADAFQVQKMTESIMRSVSTEAMMKKTTMHKLV